MEKKKRKHKGLHLPCRGKSACRLHIWLRRGRWVASGRQLPLCDLMGPIFKLGWGGYQTISGAASSSYIPLLNILR